MWRQRRRWMIPIYSENFDACMLNQVFGADAQKNVEQRESIIWRVADA